MYMRTHLNWFSNRDYSLLSNINTKLNIKCIFNPEEQKDNLIFNSFILFSVFLQFAVM